MKRTLLSLSIQAALPRVIACAPSIPLASPAADALNRPALRAWRQLCEQTLHYLPYPAQGWIFVSPTVRVTEYPR